MHGKEEELLRAGAERYLRQQGNREKWGKRGWKCRGNSGRGV